MTTLRKHKIYDRSPHSAPEPQVHLCAGYTPFSSRARLSLWLVGNLSETLSFDGASMNTELVVLPEHSNRAGPSRSQRDASPCFYRTFRGLYRLQSFSNTQFAGCASTSCRPTVHSCFTYRLPPTYAVFRESAQLQSVSHNTRARWLSLLSSSHVLVSSLRVRDHRPSARKQAFPRQRSRLRVRAGPAPGASGHTAPRSKQRGGLPFKPAPSQPQSGVQSNPQLDLAQQQAAAKNFVARQQNSASKQPAILRKTARSRRISSDTCRVCAGRGFQIIEEVCIGRLTFAQPHVCLVLLCC